MTTFLDLAAFAARQHHVVDIDELRALGFSRERVRWLARSERLFRIHRGVFAVGRPTLTAEARWLAAVKACRPRAALGHRSAAVLRDLLEYDSTDPHVIVPFGCAHDGPSGVHLHRSRDLDEERDIEIVDSIRVTTVLRTLVDLSRARMPKHLLRRALRQAARVHRADILQLADVRGLRAMVRLFDPLLSMTESEFEALFLELCVAYGLPTPEPQVAIGARRADFVFHEARLVVECDSRRWHDNDFAFLDDRRRSRELQRRGYEVMPFTWAEVLHEPARVAAEIREALIRRTRLPLRGPLRSS